MVMVESNKGRVGGGGGLRPFGNGNGAGYLQPDRHDVRRGVLGDRVVGSSVSVSDRPVGRRQEMMSDRQQRIHWFFSHLADALLIVLVVGGLLWVLLGSTL